MLCIAAAALDARADSSSSDAALVKAWSAIPQQELKAAWNDAQRTGGVLAVEPDAHVVGAQAGQKKTWDLADKALKLVWGNAPNWFPGDLVRRTACGPDPRWSYFWHLLSGDERDLHPWIDLTTGFGHLVGPAHAASLVASKALDLSTCSEVSGAAAPCLYGEVTPPEPFEQWFCCGRGGACRQRLSADHKNAPAEFANPAELCFAGPWVMERVHAWRPEIHPAELMWGRTAAGRPSWRFALVPDDSGRFDKPKHFGAMDLASPQPWSRDRPVELWIAFASEPSRPIVFDLTRRRLGKQSEPTRSALLAPPPDAAFAALRHDLGADLLAAITTWQEPECACPRGFLVLRARYPKKDREALLLGVTGRRPDEPQAAPPFADPCAAATVAVERAPLVEPAIRMLAFTRLQPRPGSTTFGVDAMARFDPRRAAEPEDEKLAERSNKALAGNDRARETYFGTRRPFQLHWTLEAYREASGARVPIVVPGRGRVFDGTDAAEVSVVPFRGKPTAEVTVNTAGPVPLERAAADVVSMGQLLVTLPPGVVLRGTGRIDYVGPTSLELTGETLVSFRVPRPLYGSEWELLRRVLDEIDRGKAASRLQQLMADACYPLAAGCGLDAFSDAAARKIADPVSRWAALRDLQQPQRSIARFVRLFARALLWDKWTDDDETERFKRFLAAIYSDASR